MINHNDVDVLALERSVLHEADLTVRNEFAASLIEQALSERGIQPPAPGSSTYELLRSKVAGSELPLASGRTVDAIIRELETIRKTGGVRARVEAYAKRNEIARRLFTPRVKQAMIQYLMDLGVQFEDGTAADAYDEYLAMAFASAVRADGATVDPIVAARLKTGAEPWDYTVQYLDETDRQTVVPEFIRRAGVLDYVFHVGEVMGVFRLVDHVIQLWEHGVIDIADEATETLIYNYQENALQRGTPERRALEYKRVLNLGDAKLMDGVVYNQAFPHLWARMMKEAARYRELIQSEHESGRVSKQPVVRTLRDLQNNLSEFAGGGTGKTAQKLYAWLDDGLKVLSAAEIVEQLALGRRKGRFRVIERLYQEVYKRAIDATSVYELAKTGDQIFTFLANFTDSTPDEEFERAITLMEDWVLLEASLMGEGAAAAEPAEEPEAPAAGSDDVEEQPEDESDAAEW
jgi:hypothetical protein